MVSENLRRHSILFEFSRGMKFIHKNDTKNQLITELWRGKYWAGSPTTQVGLTMKYIHSLKSTEPLPTFRIRVKFPKSQYLRSGPCGDLAYTRIVVPMTSQNGFLYFRQCGMHDIMI